MTLAQKLIAAHEDGERYARNLMPGLVFKGAGPAAMVKGYERSTPEYRMFLGAALDVLETRNIITDENHIIISIDEKGNSRFGR